MLPISKTTFLQFQICPKDTWLRLQKPELRKAHHALDTAVERLYRSTPFQGDRDRVEHLFAQYEKLVGPLTAVMKVNNRKGRKRA